MAEEVTGPKWNLLLLFLPNGQAAKMPSKYLCLCAWTSAVLSLSEKLLFGSGWELMH